MRNVLLVAVLIVMAMLVGVQGASAGTYEVDGVHSCLVFKVRHNGLSYVYGMIAAMEGAITFDAADPSKNAVEITVRSENLTTLEEGRDEHLKGPDFFNAKEFPTITFKSREWKKTDGDLYKVSGDVTLLGVTKSVTADVEHLASGARRDGGGMIGFEATFTIDRTDFGMNYGVSETGGLGKDVAIIVTVEAGEEE